MRCKEKEIILAIQKKREVMIISAKETGYTSPETIKHSQELDELIFEYQIAYRQKKAKRLFVKELHKQSMIVWPKHLVYKHGDIMKSYN
ncbi:Spo0E family sporulation regulatory protein-aspartic acid phosphatase [Niallia sp. 03133]|uniref:Spo0E family sporulation regulatory protein-aspartic acid phosphatase n=1 Tax=Niallia sp. 03133 TaxID=3458060 RepID=UPI0040443D35